ncbi:unnamed protein product [Tenebrio molitor]|nr:unnamed protein product [Tenebrio molitor]
MAANLNLIRLCSSFTLGVVVWRWTRQRSVLIALVRFGRHLLLLW